MKLTAAELELPTHVSFEANRDNRNLLKALLEKKENPLMAGPSNPAAKTNISSLPKETAEAKLSSNIDKCLAMLESIGPSNPAANTNISYGIAGKPFPQETAEEKLSKNIDRHLAMLESLKSIFHRATAAPLITTLEE